MVDLMLVLQLALQNVEKFTVDKLTAGFLKLTTSIAISQPHAAYTPFTYGLISRWLYVLCAVPDASSHLTWHC